MIPTLIQAQTITSTGCGLGVIEASKHLGFQPKRLYYLYNIDSNDKRGHHAHKRLWQCMIAVNGRFTVTLEGHQKTYSFTLSDPSQALIIPPGYWRILSNFSQDATCAVLASEEYDEGDYIRNHEEFLAWQASQNTITSVPYLDLSRYAELLKFQMMESVERVFDAGQYILGPVVSSFEEKFATYCETSHAIGVASGMDALFLCLKAWNIGDGDEVIVPSHSFVATALSVSQCQATPVFVDVRDDTYNLCAQAVEKAITSKTRAIIVPHLYGQTADMDAIMALADKHDLYVLEDAAQAHGARYKNRKAGSLGHAACFSFYPTKNLGAYGDGGCITTNDEALAEKLRLLRNYGCREKYQHQLLGFNSRLDPMQAAWLEVKLAHLDEWNTKRRAYADIYQRSLANVTDIVLPVIPQWAEPVWHVFCIRIKGGKRAALIDYLNKRGIGHNIHYPVPIHRQTCYQDTRPIHALSVTESICGDVLSLPLDPLHRREEIEYVAHALQEYFATGYEEMKTRSNI